MASWEEFRQGDPHLAALGEERFDRSGLLLVGTLRRDGSPRISPVEPLITDGQLYLGMMWQSQKARDLMRDPRCTLHSIISNRDGSDGEFKAFGKVLDIQDPETRHKYCDALFEKIQFRPEEPEYHLFAFQVESAAFIIIQNGEQAHQVWKSI